METFDVVMIGNTRVGKTSMLAALSNELEEYNSGNVSLEPTSHEFKVLQQQWNKMVEQVEAQTPFSTLTDGIPGADAPFTEHKFDFKVDNTKEARVIFTDTKGGITGDLGDCDIKENNLVKRVNNSLGVFCVVDASVLMKCPTSKNNSFNCPKNVKRILHEVYYDKDGKQPRFIAFILTKCEEDMMSEKGKSDLSAKFHVVYDNLIDDLKNAPFRPNLYVLAIQTMTCVKFFRLDKKGWPEFSIQPKKELKTRDCAYPLVILLKELISAIDDQRRSGLLGPFVDWFLKLIHLRKNLRAYLDKLDNKIDKPLLLEEV